MHRRLVMWWTDRVQLASKVMERLAGLNNMAAMFTVRLTDWLF